MEVFGLATPELYEYYQGYHSLDEAYEIRKSIYQLRTHLKHITMYPNESYYRVGAKRCVQIIEHALGE